MIHLLIQVDFVREQVEEETIKNYVKNNLIIKRKRKKSKHIYTIIGSSRNEFT